jgi:hypothetical protein
LLLQGIGSPGVPAVTATFSMSGCALAQAKGGILPGCPFSCGFLRIATKVRDSDMIFPVRFG